MADTPYLFCIYAEDVRQETSGQMSVIGIFQGGLRVPSVPAHLSKFAIVANLCMPAQRSPVSLKLDVVRDGEVVQTIEPPSEFVQTAIKQSIDQSRDTVVMQFVIGFSGFPIPASGGIEVCASVNGDTLRSNTLEISVGG
jgi:hypothetical protein